MESWQPSVRTQTFKYPMRRRPQRQETSFGSTRYIFRACPFSQQVGPVKAPPEIVLELRGEGAGEALKPKGRQKRRDFCGTHRGWSFLCSSPVPNYLCREVDTAPLLKSRQRSSRLVGGRGSSSDCFQEPRRGRFNTQCRISMKYYWDSPARCWIPLLSPSLQPSIFSFFSLFPTNKKKKKKKNNIS